mgnify:FL=1
MFQQKGLKKEREFCRDNAECESGSCPSFYCVCNRQTPVWLEMAKICLETKNINDTCHDHIECQWNGGPEAECFKHQWSRCRCRKPSVAIKISPTQYHCVHMGMLLRLLFYFNSNNDDFFLFIFVGLFFKKKNKKRNSQHGS